MNKGKIVKIVIIVLCIILIIGFIVWKNIERNNNDVSSSKTRIVTSFYPMYVIALNLTEGAEGIELSNMADVNVGCLHDYTLTTEDMKKVENADIFISNGLGMENFISKILESNSDMKVIDSSNNLENVISNGIEENAHIWTSIDNYILQVQNIAEELKTADAKNAEVYTQNVQKYVDELNKLNEEYKSKLAKLNGEKAICLNEAFEYMGQELGMEMITIKTDHEESTISAGMLKSVINKVKEDDIKIIIIDKNDSKTNAETIANETGAKILELNTGLTGELNKDAYINQMRENMSILENA